MMFEPFLASWHALLAKGSSRAICVCFLAMILGSGANAELPLAVTKPDRDAPVDFATEVMPSLRRNCLACHNKAKAEGGLVLESLASMIEGGDSGRAIVPKDAKSSLLMTRSSGVEEPLMPPEDNTVGALPLSSEELGLMQLWIEQGATVGETKKANSIQWQAIPDSMRSVYSMDVSPDGRWLAFGRGNRVVLADLNTNAEVGQLADATIGTQGIADVDAIHSIAFSPDGLRIATGGFRTVRLWRQTRADSSQDAFFRQTSAHQWAISQDNATAALVNTIGDIEIWDVPANAKRATIPGPSESISAIAWVGMSSRLALGDTSGRILIYESPFDSVATSIETESSVTHFASSADGSLLAAIDQDRRVRLMSFKVGDESTPASLNEQSESIADVVDATAIAIVSSPTPMLVIASESRGVILVDITSKQIIRTIDAKAVVNTIDVSHDGVRLVTGGSDGVARVWNLADGALMATCQGNRTEGLASAQATRDSERQKEFVANMTKRIAELQESLKKEQDALAAVTKLRDDAAATNKEAEAKRIEAANAVETTQKALSEADSETKTKDLTGELELKRKALETAEAAKKASETELQKQQRAFDASDSASRLAAATILTQQSVLDRAKRRLVGLEKRAIVAIQRLSQARGEVVDVTFNSNATSVATLREDGSCDTYRTIDGRPLDHIPAKTSDQSVDHWSTEPHIAWVGERIGRSTMGMALDWISLQQNWVLERTIGSIEDSATIVDRVTSLDFRRDGVNIAVGSGEPSRSGTVTIFDIKSGAVVRNFGEVHSDTVLGLDFSPDGQTLASAAADKTVRLTDLPTGKAVRTFEGHTHHALSVAWQDNGRTIASAGADQTVKVWNVETGETSRTLTGFLREATSIRFLPSTNHVVASCGSGMVKLADTSDGKDLRKFTADGDFLFSIAVTPDGKTLIAGGQSGTVRLWKLADAAVIAELKDAR